MGGTGGGIGDFFNKILNAAGQYGAAIEQRKSDVTTAQIAAAQAAQTTAAAQAARVAELDTSKDLYRNVALAIVGLGLIYVMTKRARA